MKVVRSDTNMQTVTWAVNRPVGVLTLGQQIAEGGSPTAWHLRNGLHADKRMPPALMSGALIRERFPGVNLQRLFQR